MYRHMLPRHRRLMREGAKAKAVVLEARDIPSGTIGHSAWKLHMRAHLPGGETREFWCAVDSHELRGQDASKGDTFPIRYDGDRVELDLPRIQAELAKRTEAVDSRRLREADAELKKAARPPKGSGSGDRAQ